MTSFIFVYGTLKAGFENSHLLKTSRLITTTRSQEAAFEMISFENRTKAYVYPAIFKSGTGHIEGEVYEISKDTLTQLDILEDEGVRYVRTPITLQSGHLADVYLSIDTTTPRLNDRVKFNEQTSTYRFIK